MRIPTPVLTVHSALSPRDRQLVYREDAVLAARLNGHIGNRKSVIHGKIPDTVSHELHGFIQRTVHADHADDM